MIRVFGLTRSAVLAGVSFGHKNPSVMKADDPSWAPYHSRPQSLRSFWPAAGIESSGSNHFGHAPEMKTELNRMGRIRLFPLLFQAIDGYTLRKSEKASHTKRVE